MLTRDDILNVDDLPRKAVEVPEWGGTVYVRALTGGERDKLERMIASDSVNRASLAAMALCDTDGKRLFSEEDVKKLATKSGTALERIVSATLSFNALTAEGEEDAGNG